MNTLRYQLLIGCCLLLLAPSMTKAQNFDDIDQVFECASISELLQTFELSGTKSTTLVSMMRSIGRDPIDSGFDQQIVSELAKKPWRVESIKNLEADFLVILGQFNARIIDEEATRQRLACELAKYLHKDYLINFDRESIFSPPSPAFKFYTSIREQGLWRNLLEDDTATSTEAEQNAPSFDFLEEETDDDATPPAIVTEPEKGLGLLNLLYYLVLGIGAWILLSLLLGLVIGDQRFKNPTTQQIAAFMLIPFQLIRPVLTANSNRATGAIRALKPKNYATEISEEQIKRFIDERVSATQSEQSPTAIAAGSIQSELDRIQELELAVATLQVSTPNSNIGISTGDNEELVNLVDQLQFKVEMLEKKLDLFKSDLNRLQEVWEKEGNTPAGQLDLAPIRRLINQELADYDLGLDKRIKALEEGKLESKPINKPTSPVEIAPTESPGLSRPTTTTQAPQQIEFEVQKEEEPEEVLELPTLAKKERPTSAPPQYIWYASSPQKGLFYGRRLEPGFVAKQTVYKIIIDKTNPKIASFTLVDDEPTVRLAMNIPDSYILPAMELHGPGKIAEAQEIGPVEPGQLEKEGENWHIVKKGVLHYQ